jgi:F0F1-type ATP synthase epsilon subunit
MLFLLATPEYNNSQSNTTKVKVHLRSGVAEILENHQDLMGKVENNIVEIESNFENKIEKSLFVLQDAVFVVSNQGLDKTANNKETGVYIYAKRAKEINSTLSVEEITKQFESKNQQLETERQKVASGALDISNKVVSKETINLKVGDNVLKVYTSALPSSAYRIGFYNANGKEMGITDFNKL